VKTDDELVEITAAYVQLYRETANYLERTSDWIERLGLDWVKASVLDDIENRKGLTARIYEALEGVEDPWQRVVGDKAERESYYGNTTLVTK
jgi:nitrite reductase (NADH) large subunit